MATVGAPLLVDRRQQPSSNEECISANCKKITYLLIAPLIVLVFDALTIYSYSSISTNMTLFHMVKALILIIFCALFVYAVYHPEKRDLLWVVGIISGLLFFTNLVYMIFLIDQCAPNSHSSITKHCYTSPWFPWLGTFAMIGVPFAAFCGYNPPQH